MQRKTFRYRVIGQRKTTHNVSVLDLAPEHGEVFEYKAGQFVMLRILSPEGSLWQQRALSICTSPTERSSLQLGYKVYGEFTTRAATLKEGDGVEVAGPYGVFTLDAAGTNDIAFLSGGIGITPFLGMIRHATETKMPNKLMLLYSNKTREDIAFFGELNDLAERNPNFSILYVITQGPLPDLEKCEQGRINAAMLERYCGNFGSSFYYLCGPPPFMQAMTECLTEKGVPKERIRIERF